MYEQTLVTVLKDYVKPKIVNRLNRYNKWTYGYNKEYDVVVISRTGQIGEIYDIQGLKIALPKQKEAAEFQNNKWEHTPYPKELKKLNQYLIGMNILSSLKKSGMTILTQSLKGVKKVFGLLTKTSLLILLVLTTCTCSGPRLMLGSQTFGNQTDYSIYSGKLVRQTNGVTECVILKTDGQVSLSWPQARRLTRQQYPQIHDLGFYQSPGQMPKRCLLIRSYPYQLITPSSSSQSRTVWTGRRQNLRTGYQRRSLPERNLTPTRSYRRSPVLTPRSTGRTQGTTRTTVKN